MNLDMFNFYINKNNHLLSMEMYKIYEDTRHNHGGRKGHLYEVSNYGNVKVDGVLTEPTIGTGGYLSVYSHHVHRMVAELFVPNPENKPCVDHIDTDRNNNKADNLRWVTQKENCNNVLTKQHISESHKGKEPWIKGQHQSEETKQKISQSNLGKQHNMSNENKTKLVERMTGNKLAEGCKRSEESKEKNRLAHLGKHHSEETKQKMSNSHKNPSAEIRQKIRKGLTGRKVSEETKQKIREKAVGRLKGKSWIIDKTTNKRIWIEKS